MKTGTLQQSGRHHSTTQERDEQCQHDRNASVLEDGSAVTGEMFIGGGGGRLRGRPKNLPGLKTSSLDLFLLRVLDRC